MDYVRHCIVIGLGAIWGWGAANSAWVALLYRDWIPTYPLLCCFGLALFVAIERLSFPPALYPAFDQWWKLVLKPWKLNLFLLVLMLTISLLIFSQMDTTSWTPTPKSSIPTVVIVLANTLGPLFGAFCGNERARDARRQIREYEREHGTSAT